MNKKIMVVCLGNICRSPMAEGIFKKLIQEQGLTWHVESSGTNGFHTGEPPHKSSIKVCKQHGIDITQQRAQRFSPEHLNNFDHILVLAKDVYNDVSLIANNNDNLSKVQFLTHSIAPHEELDVTDPWYGNEEGYTPVFNLIHECCTAWMKHWLKDQQLPV